MIGTQAASGSDEPRRAACATSPTLSTAFADPGPGFEHEAPEQRRDDGRDRPRQEHGGADHARAPRRRDSARAPAQDRAPARADTLTAAKRQRVQPSALQKRGSRGRFDVVAPAPTNGRPSQGIRRSCRCSDSQTVQTSGKSATSSDDRQAPAQPAATPSRASSALDRVPRRDRAAPDASRATEPAARSSSARISRAAACERRPGSCCRVKRAVQVDLQDLRELACRPASPAAAPRAR